jgi:hypothetical protein
MPIAGNYPILQGQTREAYDAHCSQADAEKSASQEKAIKCLDCAALRSITIYQPYSPR